MISCINLLGNIRVYCRVRPFLPGQLKGASVAEDIADGNLSIVTPSKHGKGKKTFTFNKAFGPNSTQGRSSKYFSLSNT